MKEGIKYPLQISTGEIDRWQDSQLGGELEESILGWVVVFNSPSDFLQLI